MGEFKIKDFYKALAMGAMVLGTCVMLTISAYAQQPAVFNDPHQDYAMALELFEKEKFAEAQRLFDQIVEEANDPNSEVSVEAEYKAAQCAMALYHKDARYRMIQFVQDHAESSKVKTAYFDLGSYYYRRKKYTKAIEWLNKVDMYDLSEKQKVEYHFMKGYSLFRKKKYVEAKQEFKYLTEPGNKYEAPAKYYYAHINYAEGNYETALQEFVALKNDPNFGALVPMYIVQIEFRQERYDKVIQYAENDLSPEVLDEKPTLSRMIGEAYFKTEQYSKALPYFEKYFAKATGKTREDHYLMGVCLYKVGEYKKAINHLSSASTKDDNMTQLATYQLGDCHLKMGEKQYAKNAFKKASEFDFDSAIKEDALFNYAKLSYELSTNPFHEAITAFEKYLDDYPSSERRDEAWEFLLNVYLTSKNYEAALKALSKIEDKNYAVKTAYQTSAYNRGIELMVDQELDQAYDMLNNVKKYPLDTKLNALAKFWQAEIRFAQKEYEEAYNGYVNFRKEPGAFGLPEYGSAIYGMGYTKFNRKDYNDARTHFSNFLKSPGIEGAKKNDAYARIGDCYFVEKNYDKAIANYSKVSGSNVKQKDYALYQSALCAGYDNKPVEKLKYLEDLLEKYPNSAFVPAAKFGIGDANFEMNNIEKAYAYFDKVINYHPKSLYIKGAFLKKGLIQYRRKQYEEAVTTFQELIKNYPGDEVSQEARMRIQDVYVELGRMDDFNEWYEENMPSGSVATQDSINYRAAEKLYTAEKYNEAQTAFQNYLNKFNPGVFQVHANYYLAECLLKKDEEDQALIHYIYVNERPVNLFSESSALAAATILYGKKDYPKAMQQYETLEQVASYDINKLEARIGLMRSHFFMGEYDQSLQYAEQVLADNKTPEDIRTEANLFTGKVKFSNDDLVGARAAFKKVKKASQGIAGAEASYRIAYIDYMEEKYKDAETAIFSLIRDYPSYKAWKVKSFSLLAEVYIEMENYFQAKSTLQSIIDNVDDPNVRARAEQRLQEVITLEEGENKVLDQDGNEEPSNEEDFYED